MAKLTIRDIARLANVSTTAVSFVLNNKEGVSEETRLRILAVIEQTNFIPNVHTRRLNLKKSFNIHIVMKQHQSNLLNLFAMEIMFGILSESKKLGYNTVITGINDAQDEELLLDYIRNKDTDGLIFIQDADPRILSAVDMLDVPFLVVDSHAPDSVPYVQIKTDYCSAAKNATNYLLEKGHTRIAFIGTDHSPEYYVNTFRGYKNAIEEAGLSFPSGWIQSSACDEETAYRCTENILHSGDLPTAIFCTGDIFALSAIKCIKDHKLSVPGDISLIGLDDMVISQYTDPPLTTVSVYEGLMGEKAMQIIYRMINGEEYEKVTLTRSQIIERATVKNRN